jgi:GLPGLI family protein
MESDSNITKQQKTDMLEQVINSSDMMFELIFNSNESLFYCISSNTNGNLTAISSGSFNSYYSNLKTNEKYRQNRNFSENLIVEEDFSWAISEEHKIIGDYKCFKATTSRIVNGRNGKMKREIVAWFAPEIKVPFGLQNLNGLPGLIIEFSIKNNSTETIFKAVNITLNSIEKMVIEKPVGKIMLSKK